MEGGGTIRASKRWDAFMLPSNANLAYNAASQLVDRSTDFYFGHLIVVSQHTNTNAMRVGSFK